MQLEDYFEFLDTGEIKLKGQRIYLEDVLYEYIFNELGPRALLWRFPSLNLEKIHACILYYLHYQERMDVYLGQWLERCEQNRLASSQRQAGLRERLQERLATVAGAQ